MKVVLDTSAGIEIVLNRPHARRFQELLLESDQVMSSALYQAEVANVLWKYVQAGHLERGDANVLLRLAQSLVDEFVDFSENGEESLHEAIRLGHPVYDLLFLTIARRSEATLLTVDRRLKEIAKANGVETI